MATALRAAGAARRGAPPSEAGTRMHGVLLVDKPAGPTSHDVVHRVRRALGTRDAGHTGTLDPAATGLLAICLGDALKLQRWLAEGDKAYLATVAFGAATTTEDAEGTVVERGDPSGLTEAALRAALPALTGEIDQVPPMYSAVRIDGRRLHEAARAGETVERAAAPGDGPRPRARRGSGRSAPTACGGSHWWSAAARGPSCGPWPPTWAGRSASRPTSAALRRTVAGPFRLEEALPLEELERLAAGRPGPPCWPASSLRRGGRLPFPLADRGRQRGHRRLAGRQPLRPRRRAGRLRRVVGPDGALVAVGEVPAAAGSGQSGSSPPRRRSTGAAVHVDTPSGCINTALTAVHGRPRRTPSPPRR